MLRTKHAGRYFAVKATSVLLVLLMVAALVAVGVTTMTADAASASLNGSESISIYLQDSSWQGSGDIRVRFLNGSGTELGSQTATPSGNKVTVSGVNGATQLKVEKLNPTKHTYLTAMQSVVSAASSTQTVVFYDNTSTKWSDLKYYAWTKNGTVTYEDAGWNARKAMTKVSGTTYIYSATINRNSNLSGPYANIIFTGTLSGSTKQTADLTLNASTVNTVKVYSSSENKWITYTDVDRSVTVSVADRKGDNLNDLYVTSKTTAKWSKYNSSTPKTTVYFKPNSSSWTTAYVHYDDSDDEPYYETVQMYEYSDNPLIYYADVYFGAMVSFSTGEDFDSSDKKDQGSVFEDADEPVYVARDRSWTTLDNAMVAEDLNYDYSVKANNFATATPAGGTGKVVGFGAVYYDYLSNNERNSGWRQNLNDADFGTSLESEYRKQFSALNDDIIDVALDNTSWRYPMIFGDDYNATAFIDDYFNQIKNSRNPVSYLDFFRAVNNSNFLDTGSDNSRSIMGLVQNKLTGGDLMIGGNLKAPYFDDDWLKDENTSTERMEVLYIIDNNNYGQNGIYANFWGGGSVLKDIHPEQVTDSAVTINGVSGIIYRYVVDTKYTSVQLANSTNYGSHFYEYQENGQYVLSRESGVVKTSGGTVSSSTYVSGNADIEIAASQKAVIIDSRFPFVETTDNSGVKHYVFDSGSRKDNIAFQFDNNGEPTAVNYYSGNGVEGKLDHNNGFFPFNDTNNQTPRDYGFGMRVDVDFTLPNSGRFDNGTHAKFNYSGDDDVWVFVDGNLILDLGGAHTPTTGSIDFGYASGQISATSDNVSATVAYGGTTDIWEAGTSKTKYFSFNNSDPTKKHHMTVFYMERGTNDSNLKIEFSIQPVLNELDVYKEVQFEDLNNGIDSVVENLAKDSTFGFSFKQNGSGYGGSNGKKFNYVHANDTTTTDTIRNGSFNLKHYEEAMFNNDTELTYGSEIKLSETKPSLFSYDTELEVNDILNGVTVAQGSDNVTFDFENALNDPEERTLLFAEFINTLQTAPITLQKELYKHDSTQRSDNMIPFEFTIKLDIDQNGTYETYDLEYTFADDETIYIAEDGVVQMRQDQEIEFFGIPVGTPYKITESPRAGYSQKTAQCSGTTGTVDEEQTVAIFANEESPSEGNITVTKTLDGEAYDGTEFEFTAKLIEWDFNDQTKYTETTHPDLLESIYATNTTSTVNNGIIAFEPFVRVPSAENVRTYKFRITETNKTDTQPWYTYDRSTIYAVIRVDEGSMDAPVFYSNEDCTQVLDDPTFVNTSRLGTITITKNDQSGSAVQGTRFALIKVSSEADVDAYLTPDVINSVVASSILDEDGHVQLMSTNASGKAVFNDLDLYQKEGQFVYNTQTQKIEWSTTVSPTAKQTYCVFEYTPKTGYLPNYTKGYVVLADDPNCSRTFGYVDGKIVMPNASGTGTKMFSYVGLAILLTGVLFGAAYALSKKRKPAYAHRHLKK